MSVPCPSRERKRRHFAAVTFRAQLCSRRLHTGILTYDSTGPNDMWSQNRNSGRYAYLALAIAALGMVLRGVLSAVSSGSNDIITWEDFARHADKEGVLWMYRSLPGWNHPPLTGYLAAWLLRLSVFTGLRFPVAFIGTATRLDKLFATRAAASFRMRSSSCADACLAARLSGKVLIRRRSAS